MAGKVSIDAGVQYATSEGVALTADLYRPSDRTGFPIVVAVHGGAWRTGSPLRYRHWGRWLASRGIGVFAINYRLAKPGAPTYPAAVRDVGAAVRFLRCEAAEIGLDPGRIGLMGDSAGAHLAALLALAGKAPRFAADDERTSHNSSVSAVVAVYGVYDLLAQWEHDQIARPDDQIAELFLGTTPLLDKSTYYEASPFTYAVKGASQPSFLIAWGTHDDVVDSQAQSCRFATALKQAGYFVRTAPMPGAPHFWIDEPIEEAHSFTGFLAPRLLRFLEERL